MSFNSYLTTKNFSITLLFPPLGIVITGKLDILTHLVHVPRISFLIIPMSINLLAPELKLNTLFTSPITLILLKHNCVQFLTSYSSILLFILLSNVDYPSFIHVPVMMANSHAIIQFVFRKSWIQPILLLISWQTYLTQFQVKQSISFT